MRLGLTTTAAALARENRHHQRAAAARWRVIRHDGKLLGGFSVEDDARRVCRVICEGQDEGYAHVIAPRGKT